MDILLITFLVIAALVVVIGVLLYQRKQHTDELKNQFGGEYDRTLERSENAAKAEKDLDRRRERVSKYDIRPLSAEQRDRFVGSWDEIQRNFVDRPASATTSAHSLVSDVMRTRGYPVDDFDQQAKDLSVNHPLVVEHYREGHEIIRRHESGDATTEEMRQAMIHYRTLFEELVSDDPDTDRSGPMGDRDRDGTPNGIDTRDGRPAPGEGLTGDRDRDGTPNAIDTRD